MEHLVGAGHLETLDGIIAAYAVARRVDRHPYRSVLDAVALISGTHNRKYLIAIRLVERKLGKTFSYCSLIRRMDVVALIRLHEVVGADDARIRDYLRCLPLRLAQQRRPLFAVFRTVFIRRYLHLIERYLTLSYLLAPMLHHIRQPCRIVAMPSYVGTSLIPDDALVGIILRRIEHSVIHQQRPMIVHGLLDLRRIERDIRIGLQNLSRRPALHLRPAVGAPHDAHRNVEHIVEPFREVPAHRTVFGSGIGTRYGPRRVDSLQRFVALLQRDCIETYLPCPFAG